MRKFSFNIKRQKILADHHQRFAKPQYWKNVWDEEFNSFYK